MYAANRAVVLKLNPITDPLLPVFERIFAPFIELGALQIVTGDGLFGDTLAHHPGISAVHMTGSEATHNAIVWGTGDEAEAARRAGPPRLRKPITSELGGVSPVIIVPGEWSQADLKFQAEHVATQRLHNSGHNCVASQIVIISSDWAQKDAFLSALRQALAAAPPRPAWYPGSARRVESARNLHPTAESVGGTPERTLLTGLDLTDSEESAFNVEYFGPVLGVAELSDTGQWFLDAGKRREPEPAWHARGQHLGAPHDDPAAWLAVPGEHRPPALRDRRGECLDGRRIPHCARDLGRLPGPSLGGHPKRARCRQQRAVDRRHRANRGLRSVSPGTALIAAWGAVVDAQAGVVRLEQDRGDNRSAAHQIHVSPELAPDASHLRLGVAGLSSSGSGATPKRST